MGHRHTLARLTVITAVAAAAVLLPGCQRAPEEQPAPPETTRAPEVAEVEVPLTALELPQTNPLIGITVETAPDGVVATLNGDNWFEFAETAHPAVRYTFVANPEQEEWIAPASVTEFESSILSRFDGRITGSGTVDTALGQASWASATYSEDGETLEKIYVSVPHPSGTGSLILLSVCPPGLAPVPQRLERIRDIVANVR